MRFRNWDPFDALLPVQAKKEGLFLPVADRLLADHRLTIPVGGRV